MSYCREAGANPWHQAYHDLEYGWPQQDEAVLCERLSLEIMQAGLSWLTVLKKREALAAAFDGFEVDTVAAYGETERARLLADAGIIRNRRKIDAIIENARRLRAMREEGTTFHEWLLAHHPLTLEEWLPLFRRTFKFTGPEIVNEFLLSLGYLPGAHAADCPAYAEIEALDPPWLAEREYFAAASRRGG